MQQNGLVTKFLRPFYDQVIMFKKGWQVIQDKIASKRNLRRGVLDRRKKMNACVQAVELNIQNYKNTHNLIVGGLGRFGMNFWHSQLGMCYLWNNNIEMQFYQFQGLVSTAALDKEGFMAIWFFVVIHTIWMFMHIYDTCIGYNTYLIRQCDYFKKIQDTIRVRYVFRNV